MFDDELLTNEDFDKQEAQLTKESKEIEDKYKIDRTNLDSFVNSVADALIDYLDEETLNFVRDTSDIFWLHMGFGMWVRNIFIYPHWSEVGSFWCDADGLSEKITYELKKRLNGK